MSTRITNQYGSIIVNNEVTARIAGLAATECFGIVGMAAKNITDGIVRLLKRESLAKGVRLQFIDGALSIDFHIIVEYGINIVAVGEALVSSVKYNVEEFVGVAVGSVNIFVEDIRVDK